MNVLNQTVIFFFRFFESQIPPYYGEYLLYPELFAFPPEGVFYNNNKTCLRDEHTLHQIAMKLNAVSFFISFMLRSSS